MSRMRRQIRRYQIREPGSVPRVRRRLFSDCDSTVNKPNLRRRETLVFSVECLRSSGLHSVQRPPGRRPYADEEKIEQTASFEPFTYVHVKNPANLLLNIVGPASSAIGLLRLPYIFIFIFISISISFIARGDDKKLLRNEKQQQLKNRSLNGISLLGLNVCRCYQELKSPKLLLALDFLAADAAPLVDGPLVDGPLVDAPLSSSAAERFLKKSRVGISTHLHNQQSTFVHNE
ncbi:hypothetical protein F2P81_014379 [Scophthalmus maximus]|uniref:Uncharacterized protein n=1 Tax=Scophthalmus maximus TaxID=52904 RepID=A0A6A4SJL1_SCOMX|nr:hypothetical protein F2P81_014379 [Scophthalmus maximus]